MFVVVR